MNTVNSSYRKEFAMFVASKFIPLLLEILLLSCHESETASTSFVTKPSDPSFAVEGRNFTLKWTYTLDGMVHISQFFNINSGGIELIGKRRGPGHITTGPKYQARFRIEATDTQAELKIFAVQRSDQSTYQINVDPCGSGSLTHDVTVIVQYQPSITSISADQTVKVGDMVWLNCTADSFPPENITWTKLSTNRIIVRMPLNIAGKQDEGFYTCTADNGVGNPATADVFIAVHYPAKATGNGRNATVAEGGVERFVCPVDGNPEPNIKWYNEKTGRKISSGKEYETGESGCYLCVASNYLGSPVNITQCLIVDPNLTYAPTFTVLQQTGPPWAIIGPVVGIIVVVLAIAVGVMTWWVRKQRKHQKDTKNHLGDWSPEKDCRLRLTFRQFVRKPSSESIDISYQEGHDGEGRVSQVQDAYTRSGKPAENGTGIVAERQVEPEAAKKKEIHDENLYETLEKPKKNPDMPTVSISPQPLPYESNDCPGITQFLS